MAAAHGHGQGWESGWGQQRSASGAQKGQRRSSKAQGNYYNPQLAPDEVQRQQAQQQVILQQMGALEPHQYQQQMAYFQQCGYDGMSLLEQLQPQPPPPAPVLGAGAGADAGPPSSGAAARAQLQQQEQQLLLQQQQQQQLKLQRQQQQQQQQQQQEEQKGELCAPEPKLNTVSPIFSNDAGGEDAQRLNRALLQHLQSRGDVYESE